MPLLSRLIVVLALLLVAPLAALAQSPSALSYQGYLETAGAPVASASATLTFRLFSGPTGGSELWTETKTGVAIEGGLFTTDLGTATPLGPELFSGPLYLSVAVGGAGAPQLSPRTALRASPYARTLVAPAQVFGEDAGTLLSVQNIASGSLGTGLYAETSASEGRAVYGLAGASGGVNAGVFGQSGSNEGSGVYGTGPGVGVYGTGFIGVRGTGALYGVNGASSSEIGVLGSGGKYGVFGSSGNENGIGVFGIGTTFGISGQGSLTGVIGRGPYGVAGRGRISGVEGYGQGAGSRGVYGTSDAADGYGGYFDGRVNVTGMLTKGGGAFQIDHPLDPATRILRHSFVESPDMMNVYNGNATTDAQGVATVTLPDYFEALNRDVRYQLTTIGSFSRAMVAEEVVGNRFVIRTEEPGVRVSWQVTGIRQDAWANANRIVIEEDKPADTRGRYLHPAAFGLPREQGVDYDAAREAQRAEMEQARAAAPPALPPAAPRGN